MSAYNNFERRLANFLERFPKTKYISKYLYQRISFVFNYSNANLIISDEYDIKDPFNELKGETFFGYYDKPSVNLNGDILTHRVLNEVCELFVKKSNGALIKIAESEAWNWQQGSMATWISKNIIAYNDILEGKAVCYAYSIKDQKIVNVYSDPIQCFSPSSKVYASIDYNKLNLLRPDYGYVNLNMKKYIDENKGIDIYEIDSGEKVGTLSLKKVMNFLNVKDPFRKAKINHCQFSPDGSLILFMYRVFRKNIKYSYLLIWNYKNNKILKLLENKIVSHYTWITNNKILVWCSFEDSTGYHYIDLDGNLSKLDLKDSLLIGDGHPSINHDQFILTDTYPNKARISTLFIIKNDEEKKIAELKQPWKFNGFNRVDLHPRYSEDYKQITIDSGHTGQRRQYIISKKI